MAKPLLKKWKLLAPKKFSAEGLIIVSSKSNKGNLFKISVLLLNLVHYSKFATLTTVNSVTIIHYAIVHL